MSEENKFDVDVNQLDQEWRMQPRLYSDLAKQLADAKRDYAYAKDQHKLVQAELYKAVTANPAEFGLQKTTEKSIEAVITTHSDCRSAAKMVVDMKHVVDVLDAAVQSMEHKKHALQDLVKLHLNDYHSEPKLNMDVEPEKVQEFEKQVVRQRGRRRRIRKDEE